MKNQVKNNKVKQNQVGAALNEVENSAENKPNRLVLPLGQTIFLPQTAMGVSYIDKVRTRVYLDSVQRQPDAVFLRGFYEIDLEYHGLEGSRLYKHRVMLPLRVELPANWLEPLDYEPEELHVVITKPMLCILSPYVLEFGCGLAVEYVGDRLYREEQPGEVQSEEMNAEKKQLNANQVNRKQPEDMLLTEAQPEENQRAEMQERLESKFGSPGQPKSTAELLQNTISNSVETAEPAAAKDTEKPKDKDKAAPEAAAEKKYHLPVWRGQNTVAPASTPAETKPVKETADEVIDRQPTVAKQTAVEEFAEQSKLRTMLTVAAISRLQAKGEILTGAAKNQAQEVILLEPKTEAAGDKNSGSMPVSVQVAPEDVTPPAAPTVLANNEVEMEVEKTVAEITEPASAESAAEVVNDISEETAFETLAEAGDIMAEDAIAENIVAENVIIADAIVEEASAEDKAADIAETTVLAAEDYADELAAVVTAAAEQLEQADKTAAESENSAEGMIKAVNADGVRLRVGLRDAQKIRPVPRLAEDTGRSSQTNSSYCLKYYVVKPGDDPMSIALKHNVPLERLRESNKTLAGDLTVGMVLRIPC